MNTWIRGFIKSAYSTAHEHNVNLQENHLDIKSLKSTTHAAKSHAFVWTRRHQRKQRQHLRPVVNPVPAAKKRGHEAVQYRKSFLSWTAIRFRDWCKYASLQSASRFIGVIINQACMKRENCTRADSRFAKDGETPQETAGSSVCGKS